MYKFNYKELILLLLFLTITIIPIILNNRIKAIKINKKEYSVNNKLPIVLKSELLIISRILKLSKILIEFKLISLESL